MPRAFSTEPAEAQSPYRIAQIRDCALIRSAAITIVATPFPFNEYIELSFANGLHQNVVITLALVGMGDREIGDGSVELVTFPKAAAR